MLTKNALGNLVNRYKAVLRKCNLLNAFGSLAVCALLTAGSGLFAEPVLAEIVGEREKYSIVLDTGNDQFQSFTLKDADGNDVVYDILLDKDGIATSFDTVPTLETEEIKTYLKGLLVDPDDPASEKVYTEAEVDAMTSAYIFEKADGEKTYFKEITIKEVQDDGTLKDITYGILLKDHAGAELTTQSMEGFTIDHVTNQTLTITNNTDPTYFDEIVKVDDEASSTFSINIEDADGTLIPYYFAVNNAGSKVTTPLSGSKDVDNNYNGNFIGNDYLDTNQAIDVRSATIGNITGDFIDNSIETDYGIIRIDNSNVNDIYGNFIANAGSVGAAINIFESIVASIEGNFIGNISDADGGTIFNAHSSTLSKLSGIFIGNTAKFSAGAIANNNGSKISTLTGKFIGNSASSNGGALDNSESSTINNLTADFIGNKAGSDGGAINNYENSIITNLSGDFIGNHADDHGGAIYNDDSIINNINGDFISNNAGDDGGAIYSEIIIINSTTFAISMITNKITVKIIYGQIRII